MGLYLLKICNRRVKPCKKSNLRVGVGEGATIKAKGKITYNCEVFTNGSCTNEREGGTVVYMPRHAPAWLLARLTVCYN